MTLVIIVGLAVSLFALSYFTKRRFGVLGLGLAAGLVLSQELTRYLATFLQYGDFPVEPLGYKASATVLLILAPAVVLLFSGPKYFHKRQAVIGSVLFAVLATTMLIEPLAWNLPTTDTSVEPVTSFIATNTPFIIITGVVVAILDTLHTHTSKALPKRGKH